jgi:hypothetical protein
MSKLDEDLEKYADEVWNKHDIKAGLKLLTEIGGIFGLGVLAYTAMTVWVPGLNAIGIPLSAGVVANLLKQAALRYGDLSEEDRAVVRKTVRFLNGFFS